jgi:hypothetical protein
MVTDEVLLQYIEESLSKLTEKHHKLVDICFRLRGILLEKQLKRRKTPPKRDRAAYMRRYRALKEKKA